MANNVYLTNYQKNKELVLNKAKEYYKNNKDRLSKQAREKYAGLSEEEKDKKENTEEINTTQCLEKNKRNECERNRYHSMIEEQKGKKREYTKNRYHTMIKAC